MTTYALLAAAADSTFHARAREWCTTLADEQRQLAASGLVPIDADAASPSIHPARLARRVARDRRRLDWSDGTVWVLADPMLLDAHTGNAFRRTTRVVLERFGADVRCPYDYLDDVEERAAWLTACLDAGEIVPPTERWSRSVRGVDDAQVGLNSF